MICWGLAVGQFSLPGVGESGGGVDQKGGGQMKEGALPGVGCVTLD